jgi:hypothetical protein
MNREAPQMKTLACLALSVDGRTEENRDRMPLGRPSRLLGGAGPRPSKDAA